MHLKRIRFLSSGSLHYYVMVVLALQVTYAGLEVAVASVLGLLTSKLLGTSDSTTSLENLPLGKSLIATDPIDLIPFVIGLMVLKAIVGVCYTLMLAYTSEKERFSLSYRIASGHFTGARFRIGGELVAEALTSLLKYIDSYVAIVVNMMRISGDFLVATFFVILLFYIEPYYSALFLLLPICYLVGSRLGFWGWLTRIGTSLNQELEKIVQYSIIAINHSRELTVNRMSNRVLGTLAEAFEAYKKRAIQYACVSSMPRYVIEFLTISIFLMFVSYSVSSGEPLPVAFLAVALIGLVRIVPIINNAIACVTLVKFHSPMLEKMATELEGSGLSRGLIVLDDIEKNLLPSFQTLEWDSFDYHYPNTSRQIRFAGGSICAPGLYTISGPSGAGKSTFIEILLGLRECNFSLRLNGNLLNEPLYKEISCGYLSDNPLTLDRDAVVNLLLNLNPSLEDRRMVYPLIQELGLLETKEPLQGVSPFDTEKRVWSYGQRRRLGLGRALLKQPSLLVLDEPTTGLDRVNATIVIKLIKRLSSKSCTLVVTHDPALVSISRELDILGSFK